MMLLTCMVAIGLAIGVTIAVGGLFFIQVKYCHEYARTCCFFLIFSFYSK